MSHPVHAQLFLPTIPILKAFYTSVLGREEREIRARAREREGGDISVFGRKVRQRKNLDTLIIVRKCLDANGRS